MCTILVPQENIETTTKRLVIENANYNRMHRRTDEKSKTENWSGKTRRREKEMQIIGQSEYKRRTRSNET